jgi:hypothetical protein
MKHLPRPIADLLCLWHDLVALPREALLNRSHRQWRGAGFIALIAVAIVLDFPGVTPTFLVTAVVLAGPGWVLDLAGTLAHGLWASGRIWSDLECQLCGDGPDDGDDAVEPPAPDDDDWLGCELEAAIRKTATTHA